MSRPRRRGRDVHGVLLLDKPGRIQQRRAAKVKRIYNANRAGHTGALDPWRRACCPSARGGNKVFSVPAGFR